MAKRKSVQQDLIDSVQQASDEEVQRTSRANTFGAVGGDTSPLANQTFTDDDLLSLAKSGELGPEAIQHLISVLGYA
jgi:hypothetical protein